MNTTENRDDLLAAIQRLSTAVRAAGASLVSVSTSWGDVLRALDGLLMEDADGAFALLTLDIARSRPKLSALEAELVRFNQIHSGLAEFLGASPKLYQRTSELGLRSDAHGIDWVLASLAKLAVRLDSAALLIESEMESASAAE